MFGEIRNRHGEILDHAFAAGAADRRDLVVIGHGVTANKDRPWALRLAAALQQRQVASLRVTFACNGESEGDFGDCTISKEVDDLGSVLDAAEDWRVTYVGHSMGGAVGVLAASADHRIVRLVSLAGMVHTAKFAERKFGGLVPGRDVMWEQPECPLSEAFLADMQAIFSVAPLGEKISIPWLLLHGTADDVVPVQDSVDIVEVAGRNAILVEFDGADHVFSGDSAALMAERVAAWIDATAGGR